MCEGWQEVGSKYCTLYVFFLYRSVWMTPLTMLMTVSRNVVDLVSKSNEAVNLMVGCSLFILSRNSPNSSTVPVQNIKMSSINLLNHKIGSRPKILALLLIKMSIAPMKMFAIVGAALVPMAMPISWMNTFAPKLKTLNFKQKTKKC